MAAIIFDAGVEKPQGAENSAVKNTAPFSLTPLRISENASIPVLWTICKVPWPPSKGISLRKPFEQVMATLGHGRTQQTHCTIVALKGTRRRSKLTGESRRKELSMNPNKALWEKGDFTEIAAFMRQSGEAVVQSLGITPPLRVLDLGCGDGTTAIPLARLGAEVVGIDIARNLVEAGNKRAAEAGLSRLKFQEGDACNLEGVADHSFDLTLSVFGAMFAPKPFDVAKEMVRVTKPGGRIVMGNWIPNDPTFVSQLLKISSAFTPPPPEGFVSPMTWGVESHIIERFGQAGVPKENISMVKDTYYFASPDKSPAAVHRAV